VKNAIQAGLDRAFYRDRYDYRRALVGFARDLNSDIDLTRLGERLVSRVTETLLVDRMAVFLADEHSGDFEPIRSSGFAVTPPALKRRSGIGGRLEADTPSRSTIRSPAAASPTTRSNTGATGGCITSFRVSRRKDRSRSSDSGARTVRSR